MRKFDNVLYLVISLYDGIDGDSPLYVREFYIDASKYVLDDSWFIDYDWKKLANDIDKEYYSSPYQHWTKVSALVYSAIENKFFKDALIVIDYNGTSITL